MKVEDNVRYNTRGRKIVVRPHDEKVFAKNWQKDILKQHFDLNPYPDRKELQDIEKKVQLDFKWLKNWYHFQRKKGDIKKDSWIKSEKLDDDEMSEESTTVANDVIDDVDVIDRSEDDMKDDKTQLVADLQRKFDELQARYNLMAGLLLEKSILKPDDVDKLHHQNIVEKISNPVPAAPEPEAAPEQSTLSEVVMEAPTTGAPIKEEAPAPSNYAPTPYAPYPYPYPHYYPPPPQGYLPYPHPPPQYYPQQPHQPGQYPQAPPQYPPQQPAQFPASQPSQFPPQQPSQYPPQQPPQYPPMMPSYPPQPQYQQQ